MTEAGDLHDRLRRALPAAMRARDRPAMTALRSALAAIDNAGAVDQPQASPRAGDPTPTGAGPGPTGPADARAAPGPAAAEAANPRFAGTVAGVGATEVERRNLSPAQVAAIVRTEIADREAAAAGYQRAGRPEEAERLRAEAGVLRSHLNAV